MTKWQVLPGPARYIEEVTQHLREGTHVVVGAPLPSYSDLEYAFVEHLRHERWYMEHVVVEVGDEPLRCLTEKLFIEPDQWLGWNIEKLYAKLRTHYVIVIQGVTSDCWEKWRTFLQEFEAVSRRSPSDERPVLLTIVRGVPQKHLQSISVACRTIVWTGVIGELDTLIYVDQQLRLRRDYARHHKLIVRQITALALWDFELADFLISQPERKIFNVDYILREARSALDFDSRLIGDKWEAGSAANFDGVDLIHPFSLVHSGDPSGELIRRVWAAQAAELLPLIEMRRRELVISLERHIRCPFRLDERDITTLHQLEIGSLAYVTKTHRVRGELRDRAEWLANCRNTLAHLRLLDDGAALDSRLHG